MIDKKFFSVLKDNLKCAFCKEPNCPVKYFPDHKREQVVRLHGEMYVTRCPKEKKNRKDMYYI